MASGLPCVCYEIEGITELLIDNGINGFEVKGANRREFADCVTMIWKNPDLAKELSRNARKKVVENFREDVIGDHYIKLYKSMLKKN